MITLKAKYNFANIMIDEIDESTTKQIYSFLNHPAFANTYIAIMPDCHVGKGAVIGLTMKMNDYIIPNIIGMDIGCGVVSYCLGNLSIDFNSFDAFIRKNIPYGDKSHNRIAIPELYKYSWSFTKKGLNISGITETCNKTGQKDINRVFNSLGSLGGGNHFIELDADEQGKLWLSVHSGSRKFGYDIANYYKNKARDLMKKMFVGDAYHKLDLEFLTMECGGADYIVDMKVAQYYAYLNRRIMLEIILTDYFKYSSKSIGDNELIECSHNYIDLDHKIIRKGAISAQLGEKCLIPFNMRDGIAVCIGKGNSKYNYSAPHGAGRILSRSQAKKELDLEKFKTSMVGIYSTCIKPATIDESPMAYKDKQIILDNIKDTVDIQFMMKPVYNFKAD